MGTQYLNNEQIFKVIKDLSFSYIKNENKIEDHNNYLHYIGEYFKKLDYKVIYEDPCAYMRYARRKGRIYLSKGYVDLTISYDNKSQLSKRILIEYDHAPAPKLNSLSKMTQIKADLAICVIHTKREINPEIRQEKLNIKLERIRKFMAPLIINSFWIIDIDERYFEFFDLKEVKNEQENNRKQI